MSDEFVRAEPVEFFVTHIFEFSFFLFVDLHKISAFACALEHGVNGRACSCVISPAIECLYAYGCGDVGGEIGEHAFY